MLIPLESVDHDTFAPLIGQAFTTTHGGSTTDLVLSATRILGGRRPEASREPFGVTFTGPQGLRLPQGTYHFGCAALGEIEFFITQFADGPQGSEFEAIFT